MSVQAQLNWTKQGLQHVGRVQDSPAVVMDNHEGGGGPTPMELVLIGVAGCTAMDVVSILKKKRAPFTDFQVNARGERADDHPRRYTRVTIEFVVTGNGVKEKDVARAIELSQTKYCGGIASINAEVKTSYRVVEQSEP